MNHFQKATGKTTTTDHSDIIPERSQEEDGEHRLSATIDVRQENDKQTANCISARGNVDTSMPMAADEASKIIAQVPFDTLRGIWKKAETLLSMCGMASVPWKNDNTLRMVQSKSAVKPHLVVYKGNGKVECDNDCAMWKSAKICPHTVAVAAEMMVLTEFVIWRSTLALRANIKKLVTAGAPQNSGQKPGSRKRMSTSTATRPQVNNVVSVQERMNSKTFTPSTQVPATIPVPISNKSHALDCTTSQTPGFPLCGVQNMVPPRPYVANEAINQAEKYAVYHQGTRPGIYPTDHSSLLRPRLQLHDFNLSTYRMHFTNEAKPKNKPSPLLGIFELALLEDCDKRVSVCFSCRNRLRLPNQLIVHAPYNLIVISKMNGEFDPGNGQGKMSKISKVYFHPTFRCIAFKEKHSDLNSQKFLITSEVNYCQYIENTYGHNLNSMFNDDLYHTVTS